MSAAQASGATAPAVVFDFDHTLYDKVRKEVQADKAFPESWFKIARKNQWVSSSGVAKATVGRDEPDHKED